MAQKNCYQRGDVVTHPRRPEWGQGTVREARPITHQGQSAQRLAVDFANKGRVVINTAVATLSPKGLDVPMTRTSAPTAPASSDAAAKPASASGGGWLSALERANGSEKHELWDLTGPMTDPFATLSQRLEATLDSYKFSTEPRSLIDWAVVQTGLDDPLSKYTRSEMEQAFGRFARDRDQHLHSLIRQLKRKGEAAVLNQMLSRLRLPAAKSALQKAMRY